MRALNKYVVLKKVAPQTHVGSIELPPHAKHDELKGIAVSVGKGVKVDVREGDVCVYAKFSEEPLDDDHIIVHEKDLIVVLEDEDAQADSDTTGAAGDSV